MCYGNGAKLHVEMINEMGVKRGFMNISNLACDNRGIVKCNTNWGCMDIYYGPQMVLEKPQNAKIVFPS